MTTTEAKATTKRQKLLDPEAMPAVEQLITEADPEITIPPEAMPRIDELITEDDTPVDNIFSAKQQRLLVEPLYTSWQGGTAKQSFIADANVGLFAFDQNPPIVPDSFLSVDVTLPSDIWRKKHRSYFFWLYGKPPEIVVEVVSNTEGGEDSDKLTIYARMRIAYYVVFDPLAQLGEGLLRVYMLQATRYELTEQRWFPEVGLGLTLWEGAYEGHTTTWLRWCDEQGIVIPTGAELVALTRQEATQAQAEAEQERARAVQAQAEAEQERARAAQLAAKLRALGIDPDA
jgi:Uma2 family endonuclease